MVQFRDPIHGDLLFDGVIEELILTEEFQRLGEVKQLGLTDKVYPGANHTRLSHALGVCFIAGEIAKRLNVPKADATLLQIAALLHDVGHYDFSHAIEALAPYDHEENGKHLIMGDVALPNRRSGQIPVVLKKHGIAPESIVQLLHKQGDFPPFYYQLLSSPIIDCDRMDYLKRDTYYTGAVIGEIDIQRLLSVLVVSPDGQLGIMEKGIASLEQFLVARTHMYQQVYMHPDSAAGETMLHKAVHSSMGIAAPLLYGDGHLLARLTEQGTPLTKRLVSCIRAGKRAYYTAALQVDLTGGAKHLVEKAEALAAKKDIQPEWVEQKLLQMTKLSEGDLLVAFPSKRKRQSAPTPFPVLLREGGWSDFFELSKLARTAVQEQTSRTIFIVYASAAAADRVKTAALELLDSEILL